MTGYVKQIRTLEIEIMEKESNLARFQKHDYKNIENTLKELEDMQNKLMKENESLKLQIDQFNKAKILDLNIEADEHVNLMKLDV